MFGRQRMAELQAYNALYSGRYPTSRKSATSYVLAWLSSKTR